MRLQQRPRRGRRRLSWLWPQHLHKVLFGTCFSRLTAPYGTDRVRVKIAVHWYSYSSFRGAASVKCKLPQARKSLQ